MFPVNPKLRNPPSFQNYLGIVKGFQNQSSIQGLFIINCRGVSHLDPLHAIAILVVRSTEEQAQQDVRENARAYGLEGVPLCRLWL